jgi:ferrous iron transport protein B
MLDLAKTSGTFINPTALGLLLQTKVIAINARTGQGLEELKFALTNTQPKNTPPFFDVTALAPKPIAAIQKRFPNLSVFGAYQVLLRGEYTNWLNPEDVNWLKNLKRKYHVKAEALQAKETIARYQLIHEVLAKVTRQRRANTLTQWLNQFDRFLTKPSWGYAFLLVLLFLVFQLVFVLGNIPMPAIESAIAAVAAFVDSIMPNSWVGNLILKTVIPVVGSLLLFIPHLTIFYTLIALLEESGYLSRVMLLTDKAMRPFGLTGRSTIPMFSNAACSQPALLTQGNLNWYDRTRQIFFAPLVNCQPRFPVYILLIGWFVPQVFIGSIFSLQGLILLGMMVFSLLVTVLTAWLLRLLRKQKPADTFLMELPYFTRPYWRDILYIVQDNVRVFSQRVLKIGLPVAILLWVLMKIPLEADSQAGTTSVGHWLENRIEPLVEPLGFDGKIGLALVCSFASREAFINYMATLNSLNTNEYKLTRLQLTKLQGSESLGIYSLATAFSLLVFFAFAMQYFHMAGSLIKQQAKYWWAPLVQITYMTLLAYGAATAVHSLFTP